ncbi:hypothetical protein DENSPDRAFT_851791 [Dentipellis sp. KUC8613]|nr:hypothetical protein DENSPDRAFT_851791 [Dentipellis sp. KUC8613]
MNSDQALHRSTFPSRHHPPVLPPAAHSAGAQAPAPAPARDPPPLSDATAYAGASMHSVVTATERQCHNRDNSHNGAFATARLEVAFQAAFGGTILFLSSVNVLEIPPLLCFQAFSELEEGTPNAKVHPRGPEVERSRLGDFEKISL